MTATDDVSARSRFAAWDHEEGEDAVYVAWHTNACGGTSCTARGTNTFVYGDNEPDGTYQFSGTPGSDVLATFVHRELVQDIQTGFDATWRDRGIKSAYFGELNPYHNPEMPSLLIEVGFHQTPTDADAAEGADVPLHRSTGDCPGDHQVLRREGRRACGAPAGAAGGDAREPVVTAGWR